MPPILRRQRNSAGLPTIRMTADHPEYSLNAERTPWRSRRLLPIVSVGLIAVAAAALIYAWWLIRTAPTAAPLALPAPSVAHVAPAASAMPNVAPAASVAAPAVPSVAPAAAVGASSVRSPASASAIAAPVIQAGAGNGAQPSGVTCIAIAGLPVFAGATCTEQQQEQDDGVIKLDNTYVTSATTDEVRRFFEQAFANGGWTVTKAARDAEDDSWEYTAMQGARRIKLDVDTDQGPNGVFTQIRIAEK